MIEDKQLDKLIRFWEYKLLSDRILMESSTQVLVQYTVEALTHYRNLRGKLGGKQ